MTNNTIPDGYLPDARGRLIPESMIKPIDKARDELVRDLFERAKVLQQQMIEFKQACLKDISAFVALSVEDYGVKRPDTWKGNLSLLSFDGKYRVHLAIAEHLRFDERLQAAKQLIDQCIGRWAEGAKDEIKVLINSAFEVDKEGKISTGKVLGLRRLNIEDPEWQTAMKAISESVQVVGSKEYLTFHVRDDGTAKFTHVPLDLAKL